MVAVLGLEGQHSNCGVSPVVISKLNKRKPSCPVVLVKAHEHTQIGLQLLIEVFRLAAGLRVVSRGECLLDPKTLIDVVKVVSSSNTTNATSPPPVVISSNTA